MEDKTFELLEKMYSEFLDFKAEMTDFKDEMTDFKDEMTDFKDEMTDFKDEMMDFKDEMTDFKDEMTDFKDEMMDFKDEMMDFKEDTTSRLSKIELVQEDMDKNIKTIAEVQASHMKQNERQHSEMLEEFNEKFTIVEGAVRHLAGETVMHTSEISNIKRQLLG